MPYADALTVALALELAQLERDTGMTKADEAPGLKPSELIMLQNRAAALRAAIAKRTGLTET
jgi:hypothetical protein